jgi:hypothetical protein
VSKLKAYKKALVAVSGVFAVLGTVLADGSVDQAETVSVLAALVAAVGVFYAKNEPVQ